MGTSTTPSVTASGISGTLHGGPNPVVGATVKLYMTGNTGYGTGATVLDTETSNGIGAFTFANVTCTAGTDLYVVAAGGNTGANTVNNNGVLMGAIGDCSTFSNANTRVWISEATTVAAAYALGNFMKVSGTGSSIAVNIGAPANNDVATGACTGSGTGLACQAAGLPHAFANALNLASSVGTTAAPPSGTIYTVTPSNASGSIPTALINTIANAVEACVNSTGGVATDTTTSCGKLFSYTTPPTTSVASPVVPTNTLQALLNLAKYPTLTAANVTALWNLSSSTSFYQPALTTAAPTDYSLAIVYSGVTVAGTTTTFGAVYPMTLDINDNVFALTYKSSATSTIIGSMTSNGTGNYVYTDATYTYARYGATDISGNYYFSNNRPSTGTLADVIEVSPSGALSNSISVPTPGYPYGLAFDTFGNLFISAEGAATSSPTIYEVPATSTTPTAVLNAGATYSTGGYAYALAIDPSGDLWTVNNAGTTTTSQTLISNALPAASTPSYNSSVTTTEATGLTTSQYGYSVVFDSSNNAWVNNTFTLYKVPYTPKSVAGSTVTPASVPTTPSSTSYPIASATVTAASAEWMGIDGANNIFIPNYTAASSALFQFIPGTSAMISFKPCAAPNGATTCNAGTTAGTYPAVYTPSSAVVDSTGSIWISDYTPGAVTQIIGTATPAWPLLAYGKSGVEPQ